MAEQIKIVSPGKHGRGKPKKSRGKKDKRETLHRYTKFSVARAIVAKKTSCVDNR